MKSIETERVKVHDVPYLMPGTGICATTKHIKAHSLLPSVITYNMLSYAFMIFHVSSFLYMLMHNHATLPPHHDKLQHQQVTSAVRSVRMRLIKVCCSTYKPGIKNRSRRKLTGMFDDEILCIM